ncbi:MAG: ABC transporter permease [Ferruginibacter sp.]
MLKNYLKIAFRNLVHHKAYSLLNIAGLAIGMACSILILLWVNEERSFDRFHTNANQLYRLTCNAGEFKVAVSPAGMAEGLQNEMPEIKRRCALASRLPAFSRLVQKSLKKNVVFMPIRIFFRSLVFPS